MVGSAACKSTTLPPSPSSAPSFTDPSCSNRMSLNPLRERFSAMVSKNRERRRAGTNKLATPYRSIDVMSVDFTRRFSTALQMSKRTTTDDHRPVPIEATGDLTSTTFDAVVLVTHSLDLLDDNPQLLTLKEFLEPLMEHDAVIGKDVTFHFMEGHRRLIYSPTGPVNRAQDDSRRYSDAANKGITRALRAGSRSPVLVVPNGAHAVFEKARVVAGLGALQTLYNPLEIFESGRVISKADRLGVWQETPALTPDIVELRGIEHGRFVYRDIGGSDPERMAPPNVQTYMQGLFPTGSGISVTVIDNITELNTDFPLFSAVNRCASGITRHAGRIIKLVYEGSGTINKTLFLVGKGVTYDTGGADIKAGGIMASMSRDKCGAAAVAGFFKTVADLRPVAIKVVGYMAMVRNSVGADCYVADELITSKAGVRVRVGNTDAEGRMAMADALWHAKEAAKTATNPHIMTIATLTGHVIRAYGANYTAIMDNGPAKAVNTAIEVQEVGNVMGDPFEISTIRRDDYDFIVGRSEYEDVLQCNNQPSSSTARGHQFPAAFLIRVSGLDQHDIDKPASDQIRYSHLDIAGSSGAFPFAPTGAPVPALTKYFLDGRYAVPK
ncbi:putative aminopeptidase W07G4.4 [Oscarella lobularis]|uniref:putative aminopeptidase W07G4.4 n=1 Tax=Oscarella lobularis TaxID=121494 RepID=UPI0033134020